MVPTETSGFGIFIMWSDIFKKLDKLDTAVGDYINTMKTTFEANFDLN